VFTARYALSPYIKQIRFVFKGFIKYQAMKKNSGLEVQLHAFLRLTLELDGCEWCC
jgi:hypothetical protein